jgi:hypothetical protein
MEGKMVEESKSISVDELLQELLDKHGHYFSESRYKNPSSRHEAWFFCTALASVAALRELKKIRRLLEEGGRQTTSSTIRRRTREK